KFPSTVALVWRWTGDNAFRDQMYDFTVRNLKYVVNQLDADKDGWPEGSGNVERSGMGAEKLDNAVYLIRGLYDLSDLARHKPNGQGEKVIFGLNASIQSVGEGNYGRFGPGEQQRYLDALTQTMFGEPATGGTPDEQPGAMPEIFPSPDQGANIDRCWTCRSMFMQAWGNYGTAWAVVHQWLGVQPDLGNGHVAFVPQVPQGQTKVSG